MVQKPVQTLQIEMFGRGDHRLSSYPICNEMSYISFCTVHPQGVWVYSIGRLTSPTPNYRKEKPWLKISLTWAA